MEKLNNPAILVVDMLNDFVTGALTCDRAKAIVPATAELLDAARKAGVPHSSIIRAEQGRGVTPKTALGISKALGMAFDDLFTIKTPDGAGEDSGKPK